MICLSNICFNMFDIFIFFYLINDSFVNNQSNMNNNIFKIQFYLFNLYKPHTY